MNANKTISLIFAGLLTTIYISNINGQPLSNNHQAKYAMQAASQSSEDWHQLMISIHTAKAKYQWEEVITLLEKAMHLIESDKENRLPKEELMDNLVNLARIFQRLRKYPEAENILKKAVLINQQLLIQNKSKEYYTNIILDDLATIYLTEKKFDEAEAIYKERLTTEENSKAPDINLIQTLLYSLVDLYGAKQDLDKQEESYNRILDNNIKFYGNNSARWIFDICAIANGYLSRGDYIRSERFFMRALDYGEKVFGKDSSENLVPLQGLSKVYQYKNDETNKKMIDQRIAQLMPAL